MTGTIAADSEKQQNFEGFDRVFPLIGGHGLYQWLLLLIVAFQRGMYVFQNIGYIYLGATPGHWCHIPELANATDWSPAQIKVVAIPEGAECEYYDLDYAAMVRKTPRFEDARAAVHRLPITPTTKPCVFWEYDRSTYVSTIVTEFDLVCERKHLVATIHATYMAGVFFGSLVLGAVSDKFLGRRRTSLLCFGLMIVFGFLTAYANSYELFILCRFAIAVGAAGANQNSFTILMEYTDTSWRAGLGIMTEVSFALFYMLLPLYAYFIRHWSQLSFAFALSSLPLLLYFVFLPESSRWLAQNGREKEALDTLQRIAARNRKQPPPERAQLKAILEETCQPPTQTATAATATQQTWAYGLKRFLTSYMNLVRTPELRQRSFLIWFLYMAAAFCYYGVSFGSPSLSSDPFLIVFLGGLMEVPGYLGCIPLVSFWGRKPTTVSTLLFAGVAYFAIAFVPLELSALRITLAMVAKLFVSGTTAVIILLGAELYPTEARSTGLGLAVLFGRIGSMAAPYVVRAKFGYTEMSSVVIGVVAMIAGGVALLLPETKDEEMFEKVGNIESVVARRRSSVHAMDLQALSQKKPVVKEKKSEGLA